MKKKQDYLKDHNISFPDVNPNPVIEVDKHGNILYRNKATRKKMPDLESSGFAHPFISHIKKFWEDYKAEPTKSQKKEIKVGDQYFVQDIIYIPQNKSVKIYSMDITTLKREKERAKTLYSLAGKFSKNLNYQKSLKIFVKSLIPEYGDFCSIHLFNKDGVLKEADFYHLEKDKNFIIEKVKEKYKLTPHAKRGVGYVTATGNSLLVRKVTDRVLWEYTRNRFYFNLAKKLDIKSGLIVPIVAGKEILGALTLISCKSNFLYSDEDLRMFEEIGKLSGLSIKNTQLFEEAKNEIKKRLETEKHLQASKTRYKTLVDMAPDVIYSISAIDGSLTDLNPAFEKITGYKKEEWTGKSFLEIVHPEDRGIAFYNFKEGLQGKLTSPFEVRIKSKSGKYLWGEFRSVPKIEDGRVVGKFGIARDITETKKVQDELKNSRDQLEAILQGVADGITVQNTNGEIIYLNEAAAKLIGFNNVQDVYKTPVNKISDKFEIYDEVGNPFSQTDLPGRIALGGKKSPDVILRFKAKGSGKMRWSSIKATPIFDNSGKVTYAINIFRDITDSMEYQKQQELFIGVAGHELKNILTSLIGFVHLLERKIIALGDEKINEYVAHSQAQINKLTNIINDILDLSRVRVGKFEIKREHFFLNNVVEETTLSVKVAYPKYNIIVKNGEDTRIYGDKKRINEVLLNLLTNAIKYSPGENEIIVKVEKKMGEVQVGIKDFGVGIPEDKRNTIFEPYTRIENKTNGREKGLGLGLFISSEIIKAHGGKIWFEPNRKKGTTFYFTLPVKSKDLKEKTSTIVGRSL